MPKLLELAPGLLRLARDELESLADPLGRHHVRHPSVAQPRRTLERGFGASSHPDRRSAGSARFRQHRDFREAEIFAVVLDWFPAPQALDYFDGLVRAPAALFERHAARLVLARKFTADPDAENEMSRAHQAVHRRDHLGDRRRMTQRQQVDAGAENQARIQRGQVGQLGQRIVDRSCERNVISRPDTFVTPLRQRADGLQRMLAIGSRRHRAKPDFGIQRQHVTHVRTSMRVLKPIEARRRRRGSANPSRRPPADSPGTPRPRRIPRACRAVRPESICALRWIASSTEIF